MSEERYSQHRRENQGGATLIEYAIAVGLLILVFAAAGGYLIRATNRAANISIDSVSRELPCIDEAAFPVSGGYPANKLAWGTIECE